MRDKVKNIFIDLVIFLTILIIWVYGGMYIVNNCINASQKERSQNVSHPR